VAIPSKTVPVPYKIPFVVPHDVTEKNKINSESILIYCIANIVKIYFCSNSEKSPWLRALLKA
tara:strand:+ start:259 stop:447 length:189 start_codon:yes stop_codon:yes gene_type:complete